MSWCEKQRGERERRIGGENIRYEEIYVEVKER